jgi:uncharacterized protein YigE (DUF2233 family)
MNTFSSAFGGHPGKLYLFFIYHRYKVIRFTCAGTDADLPILTISEILRWQLIFAMNGGMYQTDNSPLGLYIENYKTITRLNTQSGSGNFYMKPNGVFYITRDNKAAICQTGEFLKKTEVKLATQSGPLLLLDGKIHQEFKKGSVNLNIRNGVGILPGNRILFAMSKVPVNFYEFAEFFKSQGCNNALYLDGAISQTFLPEKNWIQTGGNFGVIIGVTNAGTAGRNQ